MHARVAFLQASPRSFSSCPELLKGITHCRFSSHRKPAVKQTKATKGEVKESKASAKSDKPARGKGSKDSEKEKPEAKAKDKKGDGGGASGGSKKVNRPLPSLGTCRRE